MTTTEITAAATPYALAYEDALGTLLAEEVAGWRTAADEAYADLEAATGKGPYGMLGPVAYYLARGGLQDIVAAEYRGQLAALYAAGIEAEAPPSAILAQLQRSCDKVQAAGLSARSSNDTANHIDVLVARAAMGLHESSWGGLAVLPMRAQAQATRTLAADEYKLVAMRKDQVRELDAMRGRAKSEARIDEIGAQVTMMEGMLAEAREQLAARLAAAGVPAEVQA